MRKILFTLMIIALLACPAMAQRYRQQQVFIIDEIGNAVTDITQIEIYDAGTTTATTLYADRAGKIAMTNPITTASTASQFSQSLGLVSWFQLAPDYKITITDGTKTLTIDAQNELDTRFPWYENYIGTAASLSVADNQSIVVGTNSDGVLAWENGNDILAWIPNSDGVAFDIGDTDVAKQFNFNVHVGGIGGGGLAIDEGTSVFTWLAGDFVVNDSGSGDFLINAGAATGVITLGSGTSGAWAIDGTAGGTLNADDSIDITTSAATADITIDAVGGSILIDSGEDAALAISLITNTGSSETIVVTNTQGTSAAAIALTATAGGITTTGDITMVGTTPALIVGDAGAEDAQINFDGNAHDFSLGLDDTADDLVISMDTALGTTNIIAITDTPTDITFHDATEVDAVLRFDGNAEDFMFGLDDSTDDLVIGRGATFGTADSRLTILNGADTTTILIGDAAQFDQIVAFDGNAQDFYIGLDDTDDDLNIGVGQTPGTTAAIEVTEDARVTITTAINFPLEVVAATNTITADEGGKIFILSHATEFASTLPTASTAAGMVVTFIIANAPETADYTISTGNSHEDIMYGVIQESETDDTQDGPVAQAQDRCNFKDGVAVIGDYVTLTCDGTNWYARGMTAADGGITFDTQ